MLAWMGFLTSLCWVPIEVFYIYWKRILIVQPGWTISMSIRVHIVCERRSSLSSLSLLPSPSPSFSSPPSLFSCLSLGQLKSYNVNSGSLLPIRQARTQSIPVSLERAPDNQKRWLSLWKATASWKDVPDENNSDHISVRRLRRLQLSASNPIRGGTGKCFGPKRSLRSHVGALFLLTVCPRTGAWDVPSGTSLASWWLSKTYGTWTHLRNFLITAQTLCFYLFMPALQTSLIEMISPSA